MVSDPDLEGQPPDGPASTQQSPQAQPSGNVARSKSSTALTFKEASQYSGSGPSNFSFSGLYGSFEARIEWMYRYNVLYSSAKLLAQFESDDNIVEDQVAKHVKDLLADHSSAIREYRAWRDGEPPLFRDPIFAGDIARELSSLTRASTYKSTTTGNLEKDPGHEIQLSQEQKVFFKKFFNENTSGTKSGAEETLKENRLRRVVLALGGGFALVVPMIIMVLHPTRLTTLLTTSVFVFVIGTGLAIFMTESRPQDVIVWTAAYAAVLVVFVGAGGGT